MEVIKDDDIIFVYLGGVGGLMKDIDECDWGLFLFDYFCEVLRWYKKVWVGGIVGFIGESLEGRVIVVFCMGGWWLFK